MRQFNTNAWVHHRSVSSTQIRQFNPSASFYLCWTDGFVSNCRIFVEMTLLLCWTDACLLKWRFFVLIWRVDLTNFGGWKGVALVLNWRVELRDPQCIIINFLWTRNEGSHAAIRKTLKAIEKNHETQKVANQRKNRLIDFRAFATAVVAVVFIAMVYKKYPKKYLIAVACIFFSLFFLRTNSKN